MKNASKTEGEAVVAVVMKPMTSLLVPQACLAAKHETTIGWTNCGDSINEFMCATGVSRNGIRDHLYPWLLTEFLYQSMPRRYLGAHSIRPVL